MADSIDRVLGAAGNTYNAVFTDKTDNAEMDYMDFMTLMVAEMQNQDFTDPMDNSEMMNQMVQFSNMQQMEKLSSYSRTTYAMSLVGKQVTASRYTVSGDLDTTTGTVQKVSLVDNEYVLYIDGKTYSMEQIMSIQDALTDGESFVDPLAYPLSAGDVSENTATINWTVPTEDEIEAAGLEYALYYSTNEDFSSVDMVEAGTLGGYFDAFDPQSYVLTGLEAGQTYYANIVVTDSNGVKSVYNKLTFITR